LVFFFNFSIFALIFIWTHLLLLELFLYFSSSHFRFVQTIRRTVQFWYW
jgi:hypothetical protein